jgi:hypothetical protein
MLSIEKISDEDLEDNEDELIRLLHMKFLAGKDNKYFQYEKDIDTNEYFLFNKIPKICYFSNFYKEN